MTPYLSISNYFFGMGGMLLLLTVGIGISFFFHVRKSNLNDPINELIAMAHIGAMLGLILWFVVTPTLCFIRSTYFCYQVM